MKKALSLILALVLCLSLCACGGGNTDASNPTNSKVDNPNTDTNDTTGNTTDSKEELYTAVIEKINLLVGDSKDPVSLTEEDATYLIEKLTELGDYKDSADYLERFVVLSDVLLDAVQETTDKLGNTYEYVYEAYTYDIDGRVLTCWGNNILQSFGLIEANSTIAMEYDDLGRVSKITVYGYSGDIRGIFVPEYDSLGNKIALHITTNSSEEKSTYEYDENGRCIASEEYSQMCGRVYHTYTYNENGVLIQDKENRPWDAWDTHPEITTEYIYDDNGFLIQKIAARVGEYKSFTTAYTYTNDDQGRPVVVEITTDNSDENYQKNIITYTYESIYFYNAN